MLVKSRKPRKPPKVKKPVKKVGGGDAALLTYLSNLFGPVPNESHIRDDASSFVHSQIDPLVQNITRSNRAALDSGSRYIKGITDSYASSLEPIAGQVGADFDAAAGESKSAGEGLGNFLSSRGAQAYDEVGGKLAAINAPAEAVADAAGGARGVAAGGAGDAAARGFIAQDNLIHNKASEQAYARQLPGFARLQGQQGVSDMAGQLSSQLGDQIGELNASVPGLVSDTFDKFRGRADDIRGSRASLLAQFLGGSLDRATQLKIAKLGLGNDKTKLAIDWSSVLGYRTDPAGNPIMDSAGNLIPTADTVAGSGKSTDDRRAKHQEAVRNREKSKITASNAVRAMVKESSSQQYDVKSEPIVLRRNAQGQPIYKKVGGGFTLDQRQAEKHTVKVPLPKPMFNQLLSRAMLLPEIQELGPRFALKPAQVRKLVMDALASAGITPAPAKPKPPAKKIPQ